MQTFHHEQHSANEFVPGNGPQSPFRQPDAPDAAAQYVHTAKTRHHALQLAWVLLLLPAVLMVFPSSASAAGKLRFWKDMNGDTQYTPGKGEEVTNVTVYLNGRTENKNCGKTDTNGTISIAGLKAGDTVFCRQRVYSHPAVKGQRTLNTTNMFDLWLDTDEIGLNGDLNSYFIHDTEIATYNAGGTVNIRLGHSVFSWNLVLALNWNADTNYRAQLVKGLLAASKFLFDVTDGQMKLGYIEIYNNRKVDTTDLIWWNSDVQVSSSHIVPNSDGNVEGGTSYHVFTSQYWDPDNSKDHWSASGTPDKSNWSCTLVHELGHYLLGFYDEYMDGEGNYNNFLIHRANHRDDFPDNYGLMENEHTSSEMSSFNDYRNSTFYVGKPSTNVTREIWEWKLTSGGTDRPCWIHVFDRFDNTSGHGPATWSRGGKVYGGVCAEINYPPGGNFQGRDKKGREKRDNPPRNGPSDIPSPYLAEQWTMTSNKTFRASANMPLVDGDKTQGKSSYAGTPLPRGETHLLIEADVVSAEPDPRILRIRVIIDQALAGPPGVVVSPGFTGPTAVTMTEVDAPRHTMYEGTVDIGAEITGQTGVTITNVSGGTTSTSSEFTTVPRGEGVARDLYSPDAAQLWIVSAYQQPMEFVVMGAGGAPIPNPGLDFIAEPMSVHGQTNIQFIPTDVLNWFFNPPELMGHDARSIKLCRFNPTTRTWVTIPSVSVPGSLSLSAQHLPEGIYAAFAAKGWGGSLFSRIGNVTALTATDLDLDAYSQAIDLSWTAPSNEDPNRTAVKYHIRFNTDPISDANFEQSPELSFWADPKLPGDPEAYSVEMPDSDTRYFFVIQTEDDAGNLGPPSNVASAKSCVLDTDGDGLPDIWEKTYGFDPFTPGEQFLDPDGDGLTNLREYQAGTSPLNPDTDGDGVCDSLEVLAGTFAKRIDSDGNGITDNEEVIHAVHPASLWHFDEGTGAVVTDATTNQNNGAITGAEWVTNGYSGLALFFHGGGQWENGDDITVYHSESLNITDAFLVEAWIKTGGSNNYNAIVDKSSYVSGDEGNGFLLYLNAGQLGFSIYSGANGNGGISGTNDLRDNAWHHVTGAWDGSYMRIYTDGQLQGQLAWSYPPGLCTASLGIGERLSGWGGYMPFNGFIDEVALTHLAGAGFADLALGVLDSQDPVVVNSNLTYSIYVINPGLTMATNVTLTDELPEGVIFQSAVASQGSCTNVDGMVTCAIEFLEAGSNATVTVVVTPTASGSLTNTVTVSYSGSGGSLGAQTAIATTLVVEMPPPVTVSCAPLTNVWPGLPSIYTYVDPTLPNGDTMVPEGFGDGRGVSQVFSNRVDTHLETITVRATGPGTNDLSQVYTLHLFALGTNATQMPGSYIPASQAGPDLFTVQPSFVYTNPAADQLVTFTFSEANMTALRSNTCYAFEIWGPTNAATSSPFMWIRGISSISTYEGGDGYECPANRDDDSDGIAGPTDLDESRSQLAGGASDLVMAVYTDVLPPPPHPCITNVTLAEISATNWMIFNGMNGTPNGTYLVLASTNMGLPLDQWVVMATGQFGSQGQFSHTNAINPTSEQQFYLLCVP
jgi:uncharacterized repeat protein (TIGR01451 family)